MSEHREDLCTPSPSVLTPFSPPDTSKESSASVTVEGAAPQRPGGWWNCSVSWLWWWLQESTHVLTVILIEMHAFHFWAPRQFYCMIIKNKTSVPTSWVLYLLPFTKMWRFHFASLLPHLFTQLIHSLTHGFTGNFFVDERRCLVLGSQSWMRRLWLLLSRNSQLGWRTDT